MSIKIEGGDGEAENVIKSGASNELLYNDKEVLLKENFDLGLLPPDLTKIQELEWPLSTEGGDDFIIIPENGWILSFSAGLPTSTYIKIDGIGSYFTTPSQIIEHVSPIDSKPGDEFLGYFILRNLNCPYPVKKGQVITEEIERHELGNFITFAPCMRV